MRGKTSFSGVIGVLAFALVAGLVILGSAAPSSSEESKSSDPVAGRMLYAEFCASCHGDNLEGETDWRTPDDEGVLPAPPHDETGHTWHHGDKLLFEYTKLGGQIALEKMGVTGVKSGMPGFQDQLSDQEIWDILSFIKSTWSDRVRDIQAARSQAEK